MPRLKKSKAKQLEEKREERFLEHYRASKSQFRLKERDIAAKLDVAESTLRKYKGNFGKIRIEDFCRLGDTFEWTGEVYQDIFEA
ncbi:hypothetical protein AALC17_01530 [Oscillospiraceae bacterium 38-13]